MIHVQVDLKASVSHQGSQNSVQFAIACHTRCLETKYFLTLSLEFRACREFARDDVSDKALAYRLIARVRFLLSNIKWNLNAHARLWSLSKVYLMTSLQSILLIPSLLLKKHLTNLIRLLLVRTALRSSLKEDSGFSELLIKGIKQKEATKSRRFFDFTESTSSTQHHDLFCSSKRIMSDQ